MTAVGRDLKDAEHLSSVASNVSDGGTAAVHDARKWSTERAAMLPHRPPPRAVPTLFFPNEGE